MEPDKNLKDALLRSHQATEKNTQAQSQLNQMAAKDSANPEQTQPELNEKPVNLIRSWDTLRQLDEALENKTDLPENNKQ